MKKFTTLIVLIVVINCTCYAQKYIGGGLAFGSQIESAGIGINGEYFVTDQISIAPSLIYFFPRTLFGDLKFKQTDLNINANYHFITDNEFDIYALGGINVAIVSVPFFNPFSGERNSNSATEIGLNIGGGFNYHLNDKLLPFAELKYNISSFDQLILMGGVRIILN